MTANHAPSQSELGSVTAIADGFSFPTSLTFDFDGNAYLAEAGLPFGGATPGGKVWKVTQQGENRSWPTVSGSR